MFNITKLFTHRPTANGMHRENALISKQNLARNQEKVYQALCQLQLPSNGRMVANYLGWDSASVTNRLAELAKKGRIKVAYSKRGFDRRWRKYYVAVQK